MTDPNPRGEVSSDAYLAALSPPPERESTHSRSASVVSSRSTRTFVESNSEQPSPKQSFNRQQTYKIGAKLSLLDRLKGIFNPNALLEQIVGTIETVDQGMPDEEDECPFSLIVSVWPKIDPGPRNFHSAKCVFDTGCMQGNLISKDFALSLGFTETDFKRLSRREQNGGTTATGDILTVDGALNLSWHHGSSSQIFRNMRFLVSPADGFEMIVGARSIIKYKLISPPSLGVHRYPFETDQKYKELKRSKISIKVQIDNLDSEKKKEEKKGNNVKDLVEQIRVRQLDFDIADCKLNKYMAEREDKPEVAEEYQKEIESLEKQQSLEQKKDTKKH